MSTIVTTFDLERQMLGEVEMVGRERWEEIHRQTSSGASIGAIAGALDLDRKTARAAVAARMTPTDLREAERRAQAWHAAHPGMRNRAVQPSDTRREGLIIALDLLVDL